MTEPERPFHEVVKERVDALHAHGLDRSKLGPALLELRKLYYSNPSHPVWVSSDPHFIGVMDLLTRNTNVTPGAAKSLARIYAEYNQGHLQKTKSKRRVSPSNQRKS